MQATLHARNTAADWVSGVAFERRLFDRKSLQVAVHGEVKALFGLSAQGGIPRRAKDVNHKIAKYIAASAWPDGPGRIVRPSVVSVWREDGCGIGV